MSPLFASTKLNATGLERASMIAKLFEILVEQLPVVGADLNSREFAIVKTKLEEACFYAKKSMALRAEYQDRGEGQAAAYKYAGGLDSQCFKGIGGTLKGY